jgi:hypothetical protein
MVKSLWTVKLTDEAVSSFGSLWIELSLKHFLNEKCHLRRIFLDWKGWLMWMSLSPYRWDACTTDHPVMVLLAMIVMMVRLQPVPFAHCCLYLGRLVRDKTMEAKWLPFFEGEFITLWVSDPSKWNISSGQTRQDHVDFSGGCRSWNTKPWSKS